MTVDPIDVVIVDSGGANLASLQFALERLSARSLVSADGEVIRRAPRVLLPGVGSAQDAMARLRATGLDGVLRELRQPLLGICLGMQCAAIEFGRNVMGLTGAHSTEFSRDTQHPVICLLDEQRNITEKGGTMRLGSQPTHLVEGSYALSAYGQEDITERHRHRYEFNNVYRQQFAAHGMNVTGTSPDGKLVEIIEIPGHPWFLAVQFHPEFKSKPTASHPLFAAFVAAAIERRSTRGERAAELEVK